MHVLPRMNVMFDFISMGFDKMWGTGNKRTIQNENICIQQDSNPYPFEPQNKS